MVSQFGSLGQGFSKCGSRPTVGHAGSYKVTWLQLNLSFNDTQFSLGVKNTPVNTFKFNVANIVP